MDFPSSEPKVEVVSQLTTENLGKRDTLLLIDEEAKSMTANLAEL